VATKSVNVTRTCTQL